MLIRILINGWGLILMITYHDLRGAIAASVVTVTRRFDHVVENSPKQGGFRCACSSLHMYLRWRENKPKTNDVCSNIHTHTHTCSEEFPTRATTAGRGSVGLCELTSVWMTSCDSFSRKQDLVLHSVGDTLEMRQRQIKYTEIILLNIHLTNHKMRFWELHLFTFFFFTVGGGGACKRQNVYPNIRVKVQ